MRIKGMTEGMKIAKELGELANRMLKVHEDSYNACAAECVSDMWYDMYAKMNRMRNDIEDLELFMRTGKHYDGYGLTHGLDVVNLKPLDLSR